MLKSGSGGLNKNNHVTPIMAASSATIEEISILGYLYQDFLFYLTLLLLTSNPLTFIIFLGGSQNVMLH